ncbi:hypothetical protein [Methylobacterium sp. Leaf118]|uniref:hypothetical protein n=1 Tax=Methylobacterium sp. Leaf118 TaxID=2876562 RepID=UPI001E57B687|nr:hypothetical protein [Methylobacterium sp. Leaf118]
MVVALLALSLIMILGGVAAVVQGFPYVRLESGLAMVIGGSTAASAGVILLGLTAVVDRLRRLQGALARLRMDARDVVAESRSAPAPVAPIAVAPPADPALAGAAGLAGLGLGSLGGLGAARAGGRGTEPVFEEPMFPESVRPDFMPSEPVLSESPRESRREVEPLLPDLLPEPTPRAVEDDTLFVAPPAPAAPVPAALPAEPAAEAIGLRPSLDAPAPTPEAEPTLTPEAPEAAAPTPEAPKPPERHAVGSYASGANTYVMFSDGSIEADTPRGRFTFESLDELKSFVNAGGEEARGAA